METNNYTIVDGTYYKIGTPEGVIEVLKRARNDDTRIKLTYGDIKTGKNWNEENDIIGYVGRSTGPIRIPILVYNKRSMGGGSILTDCIIKIEHANKKNGDILWELKL